MNKDISSNIILIILIIVMVIFISNNFKNDRVEEEPLYSGLSDNPSIIIENIDTVSHSNFYYTQLTDSQKKIYNLLEKGCMERKSNIKLNGANKNDMIIATYALGAEHPEFFWIREYSYNVLNDNYVVDLTYNVPSNVDELLKDIEIKTNSIIASANKLYGDNTYEKLKYFYTWIIDNTEYGGTSDSQEITSVFINNTSVCAGYSKAFLYLCQKAGYECAYVSGYANNDLLHAWNIVKVGNNYYWVDTTWGDPIFIGGNNKSINYNFFLVDDQEFFKNHTISNFVQLGDNSHIDISFTYPKCDDDSLNYYKINGLYFETYDAFKISQYFKNYFNNNIYTGIELKFKDSNSYIRFLDEYISGKNANIFNDIRSVKPNFYGTINIRCEKIDSSCYVKLSAYFE